MRAAQRALRVGVHGIRGGLRPGRLNRVPRDCARVIPVIGTVHWRRRRRKARIPTVRVRCGGRGGLVDVGRWRERLVTVGSASTLGTAEGVVLSGGDLRRRNADPLRWTDNRRGSCGILGTVCDRPRPSRSGRLLCNLRGPGASLIWRGRGRGSGRGIVSELRAAPSAGGHNGSCGCRCGWTGDAVNRYGV